MGQLPFCLQVSCAGAHLAAGDGGRGHAQGQAHFNLSGLAERKATTQFCWQLACLQAMLAGWLWPVGSAVWMLTLIPDAPPQPFRFLCTEGGSSGSAAPQQVMAAAFGSMQSASCAHPTAQTRSLPGQPRSASGRRAGWGCWPRCQCAQPLHTYWAARSAGTAWVAGTALSCTEDTCKTAGRRCTHTCGQRSRVDVTAAQRISSAPTRSPATAALATRIRRPSPSGMMPALGAPGEGSVSSIAPVPVGL